MTEEQVVAHETAAGDPAEERESTQAIARRVMRSAGSRHAVLGIEMPPTVDTVRAMLGDLQDPWLDDVIDDLAELLRRAAAEECDP